MKFESNFENAYGVMTDSHKIVIEPSYQQIVCFSEYILQVKHNSYWGLINIKNEIIIPFEYDDFEVLSTETFKAKKYGKWGVLNLQGETEIPCEYDEIELFENGVAKAKKNGRWSKINEKNQELYTFTPSENGLILVSLSFMMLMALWIVNTTKKRLLTFRLSRILMMVSHW